MNYYFYIYCLFYGKFRNVYKVFFIKKSMKEKRCYLEKKVYLGILVILLLSIFSSLVFAQSGEVSFENPVGKALVSGQSFIQPLIDFITPIIAPILGETPNGEYFFTKLLFFLIIYSIVWMAMDQIEFFSGNSGYAYVIDFAVTVLAVRFLGTKDVLDAVLLPYNTFGIVVAAGMPFVLYFVMINMGLKGPEYKTIRKFAWVAFAVVFFGLWTMRYYEAVNNASAGSNVLRLINVYPITALLALVMAVMDGSISRFFLRVRMDKAKVSKKYEEELLNRISIIENLVNQQKLSAAEGKKRIDEIQKIMLRLYH